MMTVVVIAGALGSLFCAAFALIEYLHTIEPPWWKEHGSTYDQIALRELMAKGDFYNERFAEWEAFRRYRESQTILARRLGETRLSDKQQQQLFVESLAVINKAGKPLPGWPFLIMNDRDAERYYVELSAHLIEESAEGDKRSAPRRRLALTALSLGVRLRFAAILRHARLR